MLLIPIPSTFATLEAGFPLFKTYWATCSRFSRQYFMFAIVFPFLGNAMNMIILFSTYVKSYQSKFQHKKKDNRNHLVFCHKSNNKVIAIWDIFF